MAKMGKKISPKAGFDRQKTAFRGQNRAANEGEEGKIRGIFPFHPFAFPVNGGKMKLL